PPAWRVVELTKRAEALGFDYAWTFDSHILWQEPYVIYSQMLSATNRIKVGPMVTNPGTRNWTVTASHYATLNDMFGDRTVCGIGRGDSAMRVLGHKPSTLATLSEAMAVIKGLAEGKEVTYNGTQQQFPWSKGSSLDMYMGAYGPRALKLVGEQADGFILQLADPQIAKWTIEAVRTAASDSGRNPDDVSICVAAPAYVGDNIAYQRDQVRWFGGMVGNHVADLVERYGATTDMIPETLMSYVENRKSYDYAEHGKSSSSHVDFVTDDVIDRFCLLGTVDQHIERLEELRDLGVDQFAVYLQHDGKDHTLSEYGEKIIPVINAR
ncbi:MAG: TIGR03842 family LLM class F420-dependent oxidoreductase, partial [Acidimicrobiales bacterium]